MPATTITSPDELRSRFTRARRLPQMLEIRDQVRAAIRQTSDAMDDEGDGSAELSALFTQLKALLDEIDSRVNRQATIDDLDRRAQGNPLGGSGDALWDRQCAEFSIVRAVAAAAGISGIDAGRERETSNELARRADRSFAGIPVPVRALSHNGPMREALARRNVEQRVITTTLPAGGPGGALVPTYLDPTQYIDALRPAMVVRALGARVLSDLKANLDLPRMKQQTTYGWFAENAAIPTSDEQFDKLSLRPKHAGAILEVSRNMLQQSTPDIEAIVRDDLSQVLARAVDSAALVGAGGATTPTGIIFTAGVTAVTAAAVGYDLLVNITTAPAQLNALDGSLGWVANMAVRGALLKLKDGMQRPYGLDVLGQGFPMMFTTLCAAAAPNDYPIIFGNFSDLIIGFWSELDLLVNPYESTAYSKGNVQLRGAMTLDIGLRHPQSFAFCPLTAPTALEAAAAPAPNGKR